MIGVNIVPIRKLEKYKSHAFLTAASLFGIDALIIFLRFVKL